MAGSTQYKFGVLAKIVKHMKARHQEGDDHPLTLEEILDETNQLDVGSKVSSSIILIIPVLFLFLIEASYLLFFNIFSGQTMVTNWSFNTKS